MTQRTLCLIKPDAVARNLTGAVLDTIQKNGFSVVGLKMLRLSKAEAAAFYAVHSAKPFFGSLTDYMCSGPLAAVVLEADNAVSAYRTLMGATNPAEAAEGTLRNLYAVSLEANAVHGSDSPENAAVEIAFFFSARELVSITG